VSGVRTPLNESSLKASASKIISALPILSFDASRQLKILSLNALITVLVMGSVSTNLNVTKLKENPNRPLTKNTVATQISIEPMLVVFVLVFLDIMD